MVPSLETLLWGAEMRSHSLVRAVLLCLGSSLAVAAPVHGTEDCVDAQLVKSWVELQPGLLDGNTFLQKSVYRSGDSIALGIVQAFTTSELLEPSRTDRIVSIVRLSFSHPEYIARNQDREPAVTMLLLSFLAHEQKDPKLEGRIADVQRAISPRAANHRY